MTSFLCIELSFLINLLSTKFDSITTKQLNIGRRALFTYRAQYDVIEFSNCNTEERSEAEFFCAV